MNNNILATNNSNNNPNNSSRPSVGSLPPLRLALAGGDSLLHHCLKPYIDLITRDGRIWDLFSFYVIPVVRPCRISGWLSLIDYRYRALFASTDWQRAFHSNRRLDAEGINVLSKIQQYLSDALEQESLPIGEVTIEADQSNSTKQKKELNNRNIENINSDHNITNKELSNSPYKENNNMNTSITTSSSSSTSFSSSLQDDIIDSISDGGILNGRAILPFISEFYLVVRKDLSVNRRGRRRANSDSELHKSAITNVIQQKGKPKNGEKQKKDYSKIKKSQSTQPSLRQSSALASSASTSSSSPSYHQSLHQRVQSAALPSQSTISSATNSNEQSLSQQELARPDVFAQSMSSASPLPNTVLPRPSSLIITQSIGTMPSQSHDNNTHPSPSLSLGIIQSSPPSHDLSIQKSTTQLTDSNVGMNSIGNISKQSTLDRAKSLFSFTRPNSNQGNQNYSIHNSNYNNADKTSGTPSLTTPPTHISSLTSADSVNSTLINNILPSPTASARLDRRNSDSQTLLLSLSNAALTIDEEKGNNNNFKTRQHQVKSDSIEDTNFNKSIYQSSTTRTTPTKMVGHISSNSSSSSRVNLNIPLALATVPYLNFPLSIAYFTNISSKQLRFLISNNNPLVYNNMSSSNSNFNNNSSNSISLQPSHHSSSTSSGLGLNLSSGLAAAAASAFGSSSFSSSFSSLHQSTQPLTSTSTPTSTLNSTSLTSASPLFLSSPQPIPKEILNQTKQKKHSNKTIFERILVQRLATEFALYNSPLLLSGSGSAAVTLSDRGRAILTVFSTRSKEREREREQTIAAIARENNQEKEKEKEREREREKEKEKDKEDLGTPTINRATSTNQVNSSPSSSATSINTVQLQHQHHAHNAANYLLPYPIPSSSSSSINSFSGPRLLSWNYLYLYAAPVSKKSSSIFSRVKLLDHSASQTITRPITKFLGETLDQQTQNSSFFSIAAQSITNHSNSQINQSNNSIVNSLTSQSFPLNIVIDGVSYSQIHRITASPLFSNRVKTIPIACFIQINKQKE